MLLVKRIADDRPPLRDKGYCPFGVSSKERDIGLNGFSDARYNSLQ